MRSQILTTFSFKLQTSLRSFRTVFCSQRTLTGVRLAVAATHRRGSLQTQTRERGGTHASGLSVGINDAILVQCTSPQGACI